MTSVRVSLVDLYVLRGAGGALECLVLRRAAGGRCPGSWETVHGHIEDGRDAGRRRRVRELRGGDRARARAAVQPEPGGDVLSAPARRGGAGAGVRRVRGAGRAAVRTGAEHDRFEWLVAGRGPRSVRLAARGARARRRRGAARQRATRGRSRTCCAYASAPDHSLPRRRRRPGGEGRALRVAARRGRPGRAGRALRRRGRRRAGLPRHLGQPRGAEDHARDGGPRGRVDLHPVHGGRRHPRGGRCRRRAPGRRRQGRGQHRRRARSLAGLPAGRELRHPVRRRGGGRQARRGPAGRDGQRRPRGDAARGRRRGSAASKSLGAGEILLTSMDRDGTGEGLRPAAARPRARGGGVDSR